MEAYPQFVPSLGLQTTSDVYPLVARSHKDQAAPLCRIHGFDVLMHRIQQLSDPPERIKARREYPMPLMYPQSEFLGRTRGLIGTT